MNEPNDSERARALQGLCMEIVDATMVVAARGWSVVRVSLAPTPTAGLRVADVHATVPAPPPRPMPDLAEESGAFLGVIHEAVNDLRGVAGAAWDGTALSITRADSGATVALENRGGAAALSVALDARDLDALFFTEALFDALLDAEAGADERQRALGEKIQGYDDWNYDAATQTLAFARGVLPWRSLPAQALGSWANESGTWLWAWANGGVPRVASAGIARVRDEARALRGLGMLTRASFPCSEAIAARLANLAAARMDAAGVFRGSYGPGWIFFAVEK